MGNTTPPSGILVEKCITYVNPDDRAQDHNGRAGVLTKDERFEARNGIEGKGRFEGSSPRAKNDRGQ